MDRVLDRALRVALAVLAGCAGLAMCTAQVTSPQMPAAANARRGTPTLERAGGRVVNARDGHGIPRALVTLSPVRTGVAQEPASTVRTDAEGRFRFEALPSGKYHLAASVHGYTASSYQEHGGFSTAIVLGGGYAVDRLELPLLPSSAIHGHVVDGGGDPVENAQIILYRESTAGENERVTRVRNTQADEDGNYELAELPEGKYYVAVTARPWYAMHTRSEGPVTYPQYRPNVDPALDAAYPTIFYPHAQSDVEATPITLHGGEQAPANFTLQPVHAVTVTLQTPLEAAGQPQAQPQLQQRAFGSTQFVPSQMERDNDGWHMSGLAPGEYALQMRGTGRFASPVQDISVGSASVSLSLPGSQPAARVTVTPHLQTGEPLPARVQVNLRRVGGQDAASQPLNDKGVAEFTEVPVGEYRIEVYGMGKPTSVAALMVGCQRLPDRRLHVTGSGELAVDLTLQTGLRSVDGIAVRDGKPMGGAMVILVPAGADTSETLFRRDQSDMDGSFTLNNVPAGNYLLLAVENAWEMRWTDLPTLTPYLSRAVPLSVAASGPAKVPLAEGVPVQAR